MGSLSNLYISQSYTSLVHLGSDGPITSQPVNQFVDLQDGLGNSLNIGLNGQGDVNIGGILSASNIPSDIATQAELNAYTQSTNIRLNNIELTTASLNSSVSQLNTFTASQNTKNSTLASYTGSNDTKWSNLGAQSGSFVTESETGSFARVDITNTFTQPQIITAAITASAAKISNLNYPTVDNGAKSFIQTDGAGNLTLEYVDTIFETFYAGESVPKGTPLYFSGSQGANPIARAADASNPNKMPVIVIANQALTAGQVYEGVVLGLIEGIDLTGYTAGQTIYAAEGGGWSASLPSGSNSITQVLGIVTKGGNGGKGLVLNPGPAQLPGLQTGYVWVGNGSNRPVTVATSSFIDDIPLTSLNQFTQSAQAQINSLINATSSYATNSDLTNLSASLTVTDQFLQAQIDALDPTGSAASVASLNAFTASQEIKNTTLASVTQSLFTSTSLSLITASFDNGTRNLTFTKGDTSTFNVNIPDVSGSTINTGSFATTGSNTFIGNQIISGTFIQSGSNSISADPIGQGVGTWIKNRVLISDVPGGPAPRFFISGSDGAFTEFGRGFTNQDTRKVPGLGASIFTYGPIDSNGTNTVAVANDDYSIDVELQMFANSSSIGLADWDNASAFNYIPFMTLTPNNGDNPAPQFKRSVGITGSLDITSTFTASLQQGYVWVGDASGKTTAVATSSFIDAIPLTSLNAFTASQEIKNTTLENVTASLQAYTASQQLLNGTFATTGSNTFIGNQTITGSVFVSASNSIQIGVDTTGISSFNKNSHNINTTKVAGIDAFTQLYASTGSKAAMYMGVYDDPNFNTDVEFAILTDANGTTFNDWDNGVTFGYIPFMSLAPNTGNNPAPRFTRSLEITGSLTVTGSAKGNVQVLTISSNTASIDLSKANYFTLTLPTSSTTHFTATNVQPGISATLVLTTGTGGTGTTASFSSTFLQPSGSAYTVTSGSAKRDVLSFVAVDSTNLFVVSTKNMI